MRNLKEIKKSLLFLFETYLNHRRNETRLNDVAIRLQLFWVIEQLEVLQQTRGDQMKPSTQFLHFKFHDDIVLSLEFLRVSLFFFKK